MLRGFSDFISRGNVIDLAVAVVIGAAFARIITSLTDDILMPVVGWLVGDVNFSNCFVLLGEVPATFSGDRGNYEALKAAGVPMIGYGEFVTGVVNFLLVAFLIYLLIRALKKAMREQEAAPGADPADVVLLREIRDELRLRSGGPGAGGGAGL